MLTRAMRRQGLFTHAVPQPSEPPLIPISPNRIDISWILGIILNLEP